ncbi:MAG: formyltetrahydrofolate deformylase [Cyclobacteriaceae bacterium]|nr:formyltetrahydrofolate deformylase [Cyclobacteriaceae bacterium]MCH8517613.1 formyltetrahydrofolate deformylase [Cyclobacteriaceae bacterium]
MKNYRLSISCPDSTGLVAAVSTFIAEYGGWIVEANHFADIDSKWFFMRQEIDAASIDITLAELRQRFMPIAKKYQMNWKIIDTSVRKRVIIMSSKEAHCLDHILRLWRSGDLYFDPACVISNHTDHEEFVKFHKIPFYHLPISSLNKKQTFQEVARLWEDYAVDTVVLARFMQILPADLCVKYPARVINIHHSFLPSFAGARPYHQAAQRGVKLVGATAHYVTEDLDEGPIIEQDVIRINHAHSIEEMKRLGKDVEAQVLSKSLKYHLEDRVFVKGNKTVVFSI